MSKEKLEEVKRLARPLIEQLALLAHDINCNRFNCLGAEFVYGNDCEGCPLNLEDQTDTCDLLIDAMQVIQNSTPNQSTDPIERK